MVDNKSSKGTLIFKKIGTINIHLGTSVVPFSCGVLRDLTQPLHRETSEGKQYGLCLGLTLSSIPQAKHIQCSGQPCLTASESNLGSGDQPLSGSS